MRIGPDYIQFYPTLRCNRSCEFCFNRSMPFLPDMSLADFRIMLDKLLALPIRTFDIIGGEPTLHPHIIDFVQEAGQQGLNVNISSNGTNADVLEALLKTGDNVTIGISLNDREELERLAGFIRRHNVVVKSVFHPSLDATFIRDILALGPKKYYLIYRDALDRTELSETVPFHRFVTDVENQFGPAVVGTVFCSGFLPDIASYPDLARVRCPAGTTKLGIMPDGTVYPCNLFFGNREFQLGNILTDPFESIWKHPVLAFFRAEARNRCPEQSCDLHSQCHGGCPAHSFLHTGALSAPDPRCIAG